MTNSIAVTAENLSKIFRLGTAERANENLVGACIDVLRNPIKNFRKFRSLYRFDEAEMSRDTSAPSADLIWALRDVSFEIAQGEVVGLIGGNGAGKSTLLKILARITPPSKGKVSIRGRIGSLLEVGTGFHPELTGRENVYLNGTVLGMRTKEIDEKFDEIVEFSGVERFLETPVKRYSSGMRVRLAFSVAAHLDPEILIIDEVLAVGDAAFQKRCLKKMESVGNEGRTVLFVSHSMPAITRMCGRVILLKDGIIQRDGPTAMVVGEYMRADSGVMAIREWPDASKAPGGDVARLRAVRVQSSGELIADVVDIRAPVTIEFDYEILQPGFSVMPTFSLWNEEGVCLFISMDQDAQWKGKRREIGAYTSRAIVPGNFLAEGTFYVNTAFWSLEPYRELQYHVGDAVGFRVIDTLEGDSSRRDWVNDLPGVIRPMLRWETEVCPNGGR